MRKVAVVFICYLTFCFHAAVSQAVVYPFEIFTATGYDVNLTVNVFNGEGVAKFTFYNDSVDDCSIARIYFDDGTLLGVDSVVNGPGTNFASVFPGPGNMPSGEDIGFYADREFSIGGVAPPPEDGINNIPAGEWATVTFDLGGGTLAQVLEELDNGSLRIGLHVIAFGDGSSQSAVNVPEPATMMLLGFGGLALLRRRRA